MRIAVGLALLGAALLALAASADAASGQGMASFGIRPAIVSPDDPSRGAYFTYTLEPGASVEGEALVINNGQEIANLKLYPADGVTAISGGTAFAAAGEQRNGVRLWLSTDVSEIEARPGEAFTVPFTVHVPPDASAGDHVAGWIVEAPPKSGESQGVAAAVVERVGVAVVVRVPGPTREHLTLGTMCLNQETGSNYFQVSVANEGNVLTKGSGTLSLDTDDGREVFTRPVELGTVLPEDDTLLRVDAPLDPGPGEYVATMTLRQSTGQDVETTSRIKIGNEKANGCKVVAGQPEGPQGEIEEHSDDAGEDGIPALTAILILLVMLLAAILAAREFVWKRRRP